MATTCTKAQWSSSHRVISDDNSCPFSSIALVFEQDMKKASRIKQIRIYNSCSQGNSTKHYFPWNGKKLAGTLRAKGAYTNTATFTLKCQVCGKGIIGKKEA
ncbi:hypothetical protein D9758_015010 [Tetrapyrgos nigripes]|uniref:OTU1-like C-terminal C2H2-type zinc finger domain-containing protein n=1 Tax=Tetrapyrgos nigripes TaxID=182062 RepID=A0A8H5CDW5_9AGAR|nr:hypothetical protein D9758_015010 [Tetrapyrgos nigripes]